MTDNFLRKVSNIIKKVSNTIINALFILVVIIVVVIGVQKIFFKDRIPEIFGYKLLQVVSGSMSGEMEVGETILIKTIKDENTLKVGDIVTFKENSSSLVTHRIVEITEENGKRKYILRGDANNTNDRVPVFFDKMEGKYVLKMKLLGKLVAYIGTPIGIVTFCAIPLLVLTIFTLKDRKKELKKNMRMEKRLKYELERAKQDE